VGWASGSEIYDKVVDVLMKHIPQHKDRKAAHAELIAAFEEHDCDTLDECMGRDKAFDEALREANPDVDWDEED
jgi:hypothetical protein